MPDATETREAKWGQRMIEVKVRFWTDSLAEGKGKIFPKHAWSSGTVRITPNKAHGISPGRAWTFNSPAELAVVVEQVLVANGVKLHASPKMRKLMSKA